MTTTSAAAWQTRAACMDADPGLFFATDPAERAEARKICDACPVRTQCLEYALEHNGAGHHDFGIWGGTDPGERRQLRATPDVGEIPVPAGSDVDGVGPVAMVDVVSHPDGVYTDPSGRVTVVRVASKPRWVLLIDDRPVVRCDTLTAARTVAYDSLEESVGVAA